MIVSYIVSLTNNVATMNNDFPKYFLLLPLSYLYQIKDCIDLHYLVLELW